MSLIIINYSLKKCYNIKNIAEYLKKLTNIDNFSDKEIMNNLKNCLKDKKCCVFSVE